MTSEQQQHEAFELKPMIAELAFVRSASTQDIWSWLAKGWEDFRACAGVSCVYAASFVALGLFISFGFYFMELPYLICPRFLVFCWWVRRWRSDFMISAVCAPRVKRPDSSTPS